MEEAIIGDILVLPFFGQGHLFPCIELCKNISTYYKCKSILIIPSHLSSSIPSNIQTTHPLVEILRIPASYSPPSRPQPESADAPQGPKPVNPHHADLGKGIETFLSERYTPGQIQPGCVIMDVMMSWSKNIFARANIPIAPFVTSGACATALEYAAWKVGAHDMNPGETRMLPGFPESLSLSYSDIKRREHRHQQRGGGGGGGRRGTDGPRGGMNVLAPARPGLSPPWLDEAESSIAFLINTCDELERPFLEYLTAEVGKPFFGVGPLLPESYWKSIGTILHDRESRPNRESNYTEDEVLQWLDKKPSQSVIYVSFVSEVGPTLEEYDQLADALRDSNQPFIWVIQPGSGKPGPPPNLFGGKSDPAAKEGGYYPEGLEEKVGDRGLIIKGWAPQLSILSHPSTGGFLSHCGWNSTAEALGLGVPILAWPIRGDQFYNEKLVAKYLRVGDSISSGEDLPEMVRKDAIMEGIARLMGDKEVHERAVELRGIFKDGFPKCSVASVKAFIELISK